MHIWLTYIWMNSSRYYKWMNGHYVGQWYAEFRIFKVPWMLDTTDIIYVLSNITLSFSFPIYLYIDYLLLPIFLCHLIRLPRQIALDDVNSMNVSKSLPLILKLTLDVELHIIKYYILSLFFRRKDSYSCLYCLLILFLLFF